jgi:DNA-binding NarL/FixJ family response regulator
LSPEFQYRNDTVGENDNLSYAGAPRGNGIFGTEDKWDNPDKALLRILAAIILPVLAAGICIFLVLRKRALKKLMEVAQEATDKVPENIFENADLSPREKEVGKLLLTELSMKQIATVMHIAYTTADYHSRKLYRKMGVEGRTELLIRVKREK